MVHDYFMHPSHNYSYTIFYKVPYSKIMNFIDTSGTLWNSFDKDTNSILVDEGIDKEEVVELITDYENNFVEAVNSNNFDLLKNTLIPDSSLYKSQKALVPELNKKGIKEELKEFSIEEIIFDENYYTKVTVREVIGISTKGGPYIDKEFLWSYKLGRDKNGDLQMFNIESAGE